jgi:hypothetical protein
VRCGLACGCYALAMYLSHLASRFQLLGFTFVAHFRSPAEPFGLFARAHYTPTEPPSALCCLSVLHLAQSHLFA